jgi:hypothetical protein
MFYDCSSTSLSILALRVLGLRAALLSIFPFYDWLMLARPCLDNSLLDLSFLKASILASALSVADSLACEIPRSFTRLYSFPNM